MIELAQAGGFALGGGPPIPTGDDLVVALVGLAVALSGVTVAAVLLWKAFR